MQQRLVLVVGVLAIAVLLAAIIAGPLIPQVLAGLRSESKAASSEPVRLSATVNITGEGTREEDLMLFVPGGFGKLVPGHKRLVIESVAVNAFVPRGQGIALVSLLSTLNGAQGGFPLTLQHQSSGQNTDSLSGTYPIRLYADPGTKVRVLVSRGAAAGAAVITITASGYLVDLT